MIEDDPSDLVHDLAARCVFGEHELGRPVIGSAATVRALSNADVAGYHARRYGAGNVVVAAAGNIEHDAFCALVGERLRLGVATRAERSTPALDGSRRLFLARDTEQYHVCLSAPGLPRDDERRFALALLDHVLGGAASSRLVQEIREQRGMAYSVYSYTSNYDDAGQIGIYVGTRAENVGECVEIARAEVADLRAGGLSADELERAKESVKGRMLLALESTSSRMSRLGRAVLSGSEILSLDEVAARIDAVTHASVTQLAERAARARAPLDRGHRPRSRSLRDRRGRRRRAAGGGRVIRVVLAGASGRTGAPVAASLAAADDLELVARVAPSLAGAGEDCFGSVADALATVAADVFVDLTRPELGEEHALAALASGLAVVLGTTGLDAAARERLDAAGRAAGLPVFYAPNFSLGAVLAMQFAEQAAQLFPHVEIVELHSHHKLDAPSGTAEATAERIRAVTGHDVPIHSVRLPGLIAHQETLLGGEGQLLTIRHDATSREAFAPGVLLAVRRVRELPPGLTVGLETFLAG